MAERELERRPSWRGVVKRALASRGYRLGRASGRNATVYPDDRWIVSYPRSGSTWASFLVTNLLHPDAPTTFTNLAQRCPDSYVYTDAFLTRLPRPRLVKSHQSFDPRYPQVVYIVRDPRDVVLSYYRYAIKALEIGEDYVFDAFAHEFVAHGWQREHGTWEENVGSWLGARGGSDSFHLVRYEDLHADPVGRLGEIAAFLGIATSRSRLEQAVELSSSNRMRSLEASERGAFGRVRDDVPFVGPALAGGWRDRLEQRHQEAIAAAWGKLMKELGYLV